MSRIETAIGMVLLISAMVLVGYTLASLPSQKEIQAVVEGISK